MKTPICYTNPFLVSDELKETILSFCFTTENLEEIKNMLEASNVDYEGENEPLITEISKILKDENDVIEHLNVG